MVLSMRKIVFPILPGQVYVGTQSAHNGWKVKVIRVSANHIGAEVIKPNHGDVETYQTDVFRRDFELTQDVPEEKTHMLDDVMPTRKGCVECNTEKPISDFQPVIIKRGKNKGTQTGYMAKCKTCLNEARSAGRRAAMPQAATSTDVAPTYTQEPLIDATESLSHTVLGLATRIEELENFAKDRPKYEALVQAVQSVYTSADQTHGIYVVPEELFTTMSDALVALTN